MSMGITIPSIIMAITIVCMFIFCKKLKYASFGIPVFVLMFAIILACVSVILFQTGVVGSNVYREIKSKELKFAYASSYVMAKYLAEKNAGEKCLIIAREGFEDDEKLKIILQGVKGGIKDKLKCEAVRSLYLSDNLESKDSFVKFSEFDKLTREYNDCQVFVSLIGLPTDYEKLYIYRRKKKGKKRRTIGLMNAHVKVLKQAVEKEFVSAVVLYRPGLKFDPAPPPDNAEDAFKLRYLMITPENIEKIAGEFPDLFK